MTKTPGVMPCTRLVFLMLALFLCETLNAQIALRGAATAATSASSTLTIAKPDGVVQGDIMLVNIASRGSTSAASASGWTRIRSNSLTSSPSRYATILYRIAGASEPASYTFNAGSGTVGAAGGMVAFSGVNTSTPFDVSTPSIREQTSTTVTANSISPVSPNAAIVFMGQAVGSAGGASISWNSSNWKTSNAPGALTELLDVEETNYRVSVGAAWGIRATAGSTGNGTVPISTYVRNGGVLIALRAKVLDATAPVVNSTVPASNAVNVSTTTAISATFSEALTPSSVSGTNFFLRAGATSIPATISYTSGGTTATLTPSAALTPGTVYTATLKGGSTGIRDVEGNAMAADYVWSFTTAAAQDLTPPAVISTSPLQGAVGISTSTGISAVFSEPLNAASVNSANMYLQAGATTVPATVSYTAGSTIVNLLPSSPLSQSTQYTVTIKGGSTGIRDVAGNALTDDVTWSFTTASAPVGGGDDIVAENALPGSPASEWDVSASGDPSIQGFATEMSVNRGSSVRFKINVTGSSTSYNIRIYRLGYYGGNGARLVADLGSFTGITQPAPTVNAAIGFVDYNTWSESAAWNVPANAVSGIYIAKLTRASSGGSSHIVFVVRNDASTAPILFKTADATWQAYNSYGGYSFYDGSTSNVNGRADKLSYNRPFNTRSVKPQCFLFNAEYPMLRWLERNGYQVTYATDVDMERNTSPITPSKYKVMLSVGHDEYWSLNMRNNYENARNAGVHLAFFSGNEVYWKTRWENNTRTLVCYKEGASSGQGEYNCGGNCDPATGVWTGLWRFGCEYGEDGCRPENALTGQLSWTESSLPMQVPYEFRNLPFWRNTSVANLQPGQVATMSGSILGYEWNYEQPAFAGSNPPGRITMSSTTFNGLNHRISLYRHSSGAIVFGAGTVQWSWGLDNVHDRESTTPSRDMQQATLNLLRDMGVSPGTMQGDLTLSSPINDATAPVSVINAPANGATVSAGTQVTISGTASDAFGINRVEVSVNGGQTWQAASGTTSWSFSWTPLVGGAVVIKSRAIDNNGNAETPGNAPASNAINLNVSGSGSGNCPCTVFNTTQAVQPTASVAKNDGTGLNIGMKFIPNQNGFVTALRFYKSINHTGTHTGQLYTATGTPLATAVFTNETASGWQQVNLSSPVALTAGTTYVVSYHSALGNYSATENYFTSSVVSGPLTAPSSGSSGGNGLYLYGATPAMPVSTYNASNYWVDVVFNTSTGSDQTAPTVSSTTPASNATGVSQAAGITAVFSEALDPSSVNASNVFVSSGSVTVPAAVGYTSGSQTVTLTPSSSLAAGTVYTVTLRGGSSGIKDVAGNNLASNYTWSFTTASAPPNPGVCPCTVFNSSQAIQPTGSAAKNDGIALNVGMKFIPSQNGYVTALRFYKSPNHTGTHTGQLHTAAGVQLASAVFTGETASGWQQVNLSTPVAVTAGTTYVVSYHSALGNYSSTENYFTASVVNGPLTAPSSASSGGNGLYLYGATPAMPVSTYNASNYWVDVVFNTTISSGARISTQENLMNDNPGSSSLNRLSPRGALAYSLSQNAPNPSSGLTYIRYSLPAKSQVSLSLYDMQGRQVKVLVKAVKEAGEYVFELDTRTLAKGIYFYQMQADGFSSSKRLMVE